MGEAILIKTCNGVTTKTTTYQVVLNKENWNSNGKGFSQQISIEGLQNGDIPIINVLNDSENSDERKSITKNWGYVNRIVVENGNITAYAYENKPTIDLNIQLNLNRSGSVYHQHMMSDLSGVLDLSKGGTGINASNLQELKDHLGIVTNGSSSGDGIIMSKIAFGSYEGEELSSGETTTKSINVGFSPKVLIIFGTTCSSRVVWNGVDNEGVWNCQPETLSNTFSGSVTGKISESNVVTITTSGTNSGTNSNALHALNYIDHTYIWIAFS